MLLAPWFTPVAAAQAPAPAGERHCGDNQLGKDPEGHQAWSARLCLTAEGTKVTASVVQPRCWVKFLLSQHFDPCAVEPGGTASVSFGEHVISRGRAGFVAPYPGPGTYRAEVTVTITARPESGSAPWSRSLTLSDSFTFTADHGPAAALTASAAPAGLDRVRLTLTNVGTGPAARAAVQTAGGRRVRCGGGCALGSLAPKASAAVEVAGWVWGRRPTSWSYGYDRAPRPGRGPGWDHRFAGPVPAEPARRARLLS
ncbi:hypothetical protein GCM10009560_45350 [Nonomuraea longicatena]|uniref:Uncharacterized protein n=2 Tax=Nonomuraea longicatena TaxID=83682 RepID=A0ABP4AH98_9ACTN